MAEHRGLTQAAAGASLTTVSAVGEMGDPTMSSSPPDPSTDTVAQWIDNSLITDTALLNLMESDNSLPFNGFDFGPNSSPGQHFAESNDFELPNGFGDGYVLSELTRKPSIVTTDATSGSRSTIELTSVQERPIVDDVAKVKKERRRAQNRKAQQAFRQRKDIAIAQLEREMERLRSINQGLSQTNKARVQEISELQARLGVLRFAPLSPSIEGQDAVEKNAEFSPSSWDSPPAEEPMSANTVPRMKWQGRLYDENEAMATSSTENGGFSCAGPSVRLVQEGGDGFRR